MFCIKKEKKREKIKREKKERKKLRGGSGGVGLTNENEKHDIGKYWQISLSTNLSISKSQNVQKIVTGLVENRNVGYISNYNQQQKAMDDVEL